MASKVLFMPFDPKHTAFKNAVFEYGKSKTGLDKNQQWIDRDFEQEKETAQAWYNGKKNSHIASMNTGSIYIRGHGMPGFISIEGGRSGERVHYTAVVDRLIKSGLQKTFSGKIKCYNCHSAESGVVGTDPEILNGDPFAQSIADELVTRGYKYCTIFGYDGAIDSYYMYENKKNPTGDMHKYRREYVRNQATGVSRLEATGRASDNRKVFSGRVKATVGKPGFFQKLFS